MPLNKSKGNMYGFVTHTHTHIGGECPHKCSYCYVQAIEKRFSGGKYRGKLRLNKDELEVNYGKDRIIFIEHCNDMWAEGVPSEWVEQILAHCNRYPENEYVFQTKNPARYYDFNGQFPPSKLMGCTAETVDEGVAGKISNAPNPEDRLNQMDSLSAHEKTFITIEPILRGDMEKLAAWISLIAPEFVNIGADSKGTGLDEPSADDIRLLLNELKRYGVEIKQKTNLDRLLR